MKSISIVMMIVMLGLSAHATNLSQDFTFDGYLLDGSSNPLTGNHTVRFQIYNPGATCLIFEETHATVTAGSDGSFSLKVGTGTRASPGADGGLPWKTIFQNSVPLRAAATTNCSPGYTPASGDQRKLRVTVGGTVLSPDYVMSAVPMATVAETLQGKAATDFVAVDGDSIIEGNLKLNNYGELRLHGAGSFYTGFKGPAALGSNTVYTLPNSVGTNGQCLATDGTGNLNWTTVAAPGSAISSLNGLTNAAQTFNFGTSGVTPNFSSTASIHTLNLPMANTSAVTAGLISKVEYDTFNNKMNPVAGVGDNLMRYDGTNWVATNAITVDGTGYVALNNPPVSANQVATKAYVDAATTSLNDVDIIDVGVDKITNGLGRYFAYAPNNTQCANGETLTWNSVTPGWECHMMNFVPFTGGMFTGAIGFSGFGSASSTQLAVAGASTGLYAPSSNQIGFSASGTEKMRITGSGVGFGVTNPTAALEVGGPFKVGAGGTGSAVNLIKNYPALTCSGFVSISAGATGTCTATLGSAFLADNLSINCLPENAAPTQAMIHSCYLSANNTLTIAVHNIGGVAMTPPNYWNVTVTKF